MISPTTGLLLAQIDGRGVWVPTPAQGVTPTATLSPTYTLYERQWGYNAQGDLTSASTPPITTTTLNGATQANAAVTTLITPDGDGNPITLTTPNGASSVTLYDHLGHLVQTTGPSVSMYNGTAQSPLATLGYDGDGHVVTTTNALGDTTTRSYDPLGRLVARTNPLGAQTLYTYTATTLSMVQDPAGHVTRYGSDAAGQRTSATDPLGTTRQQYAYDPVGNTTVITAPLSYFYILTNTVETRGYNALDEPITNTVQGAGEATPTTPQATSYTYDHDGNLLQGITPGGSLTANSYDLADRVRTIAIYGSAQAISPVASSTISLDAADNPTDRFAMGLYDQQIRYDGADRLTQRTDCQQVCPGTAAITTVPSYDPDGNVLGLTRQASEATTTYTGTYNAADWLLSQSDGALGTTTYGYDAAGRQRTMSLLNGAGLVTNTLDAAGRATSLSESVTDTTPATTTGSSSTFTYTADDLPLTDTLASALVQGRRYDADNRLTALTTTPINGENYSYGYDPQSRTITATLPANNTPLATLDYNALGQLSRETNSANGAVLGSWTYDGNGNLLTEGTLYSYAYSYATGVATPTNWLPNELVSAQISGGTFFYKYDNVGAATVIDGGNTRYQTLSYNAQGLLRGVTSTITPTGQGATTTTAAITYNARGLRDSLTITAQGQSQPSFGERFLYRGDQVGEVSVTTPLTTFTETFLYRPSGAPMELLYQTPGQVTKRYYYVLDGRNNVMGLVDGSGSGTLVNTYSYDVWGAPTTISEAVPQPLRYGGYWYDGWDNTGDSSGQTWNNGPLPWYWLGQRSYDPALRRFLQPDPATSGGVPDYVYANDAPLDLSDPSGQAGVPSACGQTGYVDQGANVTACGWAAVRAQQEAATQAALWAVPNFFVLDPLRATIGPNSSAGERILGGLALLPLAGWIGHGVGLVSDVARGLAAARDLAAVDDVAPLAGSVQQATSGVQAVESSDGELQQLPLPFEDMPPLSPKPPRYEWHHVYPKYLGGPEDQPLVSLPHDYHVAIHNALDRIFPRAAGMSAYTNVDSADVWRALSRVYNRYPLDIDPTTGQPFRWKW